MAPDTGRRARAAGRDRLAGRDGSARNRRHDPPRHLYDLGRGGQTQPAEGDKVHGEGAQRLAHAERGGTCALRRSGRVYARGYAREGRLVLRVRATLARGRYVLVLQRGRVIERETIRIS